MSVFDNLRAQLEQLDWPNVYLFKFIVPNDNERMAQVSALFDEQADISYHQSGGVNYVSVCVKEVMLTVDSIIVIYEKATQIKGVISL